MDGNYKDFRLVQRWGASNCYSSESARWCHTVGIFFPLTVDFASFDPDVMEGQSDCGVYFKCYVVHECSQDSGLAKGTLQKREEYESSRARACL